MSVARLDIPVPALAVRDLVVTLTDGAAVVDDVSFTLAQGEILGLVGESGSGKSTIANALLGYARSGTRIARGEVVVAGRDLLRLDPSGLRAARGDLIAHVPQDPALALDPLDRIGAIVGEVLLVHRADLSADERLKAVRRTLRAVGLPDDDAFLRRYPHQLSGGQQQRVLLALAFVLEPKVIVLDEPTTALDVTTQAQVLQLIRGLCREHGIAALYVSHDLSIVRGLVDRVAVLYAGRIAELARREAVFERPVHPYTRRLLGAVPEVATRHHLETIPGHTEPPGRRPSGCAFRQRCDRADARCAAERPVLADTGQGTLVACHYPVSGQMLQRPELPAAPEVGEGSAPLLAGCGISAAYGGHQVLHDLSFELAPKLCTALVGQSGSGKTTLARAIAGLGDDVVGDLLFDGAAVVPGGQARSRELRRRIQYIFQNPYRALNPRRSVGDNLTQVVRHFFQISPVEAEARVIAALSRVALPLGVRDRRPGELSGGERQRVAIARALLCQPDLLICDEITSALDVSVQAAVLALLDDLKRDGLTILFVTHDLGVVRAIADQVLVLKDGHLVERGTVTQVLDHPAHAYTRQLVDDSRGERLSEPAA